MYIGPSSVNIFSLVLVLNQVLRCHKEEKLFSADVILLLRKPAMFIVIGCFTYKTQHGNGSWYLNFIYFRLCVM